uniref:LPXTG cell wall anchor domain-containing protein n=1 Tax=Lactobacillus laiwuensis TaxID=2841034 RepID=UPI0035A2251D
MSTGSSSSNSSNNSNGSITPNGSSDSNGSGLNSSNGSNTVNNNNNRPTPIPNSKKSNKKSTQKSHKKHRISKHDQKSATKSVKGLTANKHQANRPAKLAAAGRKLNNTASADPQKGKLDKGSSNDALPQTGAEKHNSLAMLALGGLALATALGAAWLERKKD